MELLYPSKALYTTCTVTNTTQRFIVGFYSNETNKQAEKGCTSNNYDIVNITVQ